jgi:hypothetical protein
MSVSKHTMPTRCSHLGRSAVEGACRTADSRRASLLPRGRCRWWLPVVADFGTARERRPVLGRRRNLHVRPGLPSVHLHCRGRRTVPSAISVVWRLLSGSFVRLPRHASRGWSRVGTRLPCPDRSPVALFYWCSAWLESLRRDRFVISMSRAARMPAAVSSAVRGVPGFAIQCGHMLIRVINPVCRVGCFRPGRRGGRPPCRQLAWRLCSAVRRGHG